MPHIPSPMQQISRTALWIIVVTIGAAILALLGYSLDRTSWLFRLYETGQAHASELGLAAAIVVELACVGLIAGESVAALLPDEPTRKAVRVWASWGLVSLLSVQVIANLLAGYLRGTAALSDELAAVRINTGLLYSAISGITWFAANSLIPFLIFGLAKMEAYIIRLLIVTPAPQTSSKPISIPQQERPPQLSADILAPLAPPLHQGIPIEHALIDGLSQADRGANEESTHRLAKRKNGTSYPCPHCGASLESIGELGAAKRWKHCRHCKGNATISVAYPREQSQNGTSPE
jgi:hypothetical protein